MDNPVDPAADVKAPCEREGCKNEQGFLCIGHDCPARPHPIGEPGIERLWERADAADARLGDLEPRLTAAVEVRVAGLEQRLQAAEAALDELAARPGT